VPPRVTYHSSEDVSSSFVLAVNLHCYGVSVGLICLL